MPGEADGGWNDWLFNKIRNTDVTGMNAVVLNEGTTDIPFDNKGTVNWKGKKNFVGVSETEDGRTLTDAADFTKIHLDCGTSLSLKINATGASKLVIYSLTEKKDRNGSTVSFTKKALQTTKLGKPKTADGEYMEESKPLLLEKGDYYISMESTDIRKGGSAFYNVTLNDLTKFYSDDDDGTNNWVYDRKLKVLNPDEGDLVETKLNNKTTDVQLDKAAVSYTDGFKNTYSNFVGYGDDTDFGKIWLEGSAKLSFSIRATNAAKFTVYTLNVKWNKKNQPVYSLKALQTTKLKKVNANLYEVSTKALKLASGIYSPSSPPPPKRAAALITT